MTKINSKMIYISEGEPKELSNFLEHDLPDCMKILTNGGVIIFPTETLYGLGVDIKNDTALEKLLRLKNRPANMPIAVALSGLEQARALVELTELSMKVIQQCMLKPVTILLPAKNHVSIKLTGTSNLLGLRFPDNKVTAAILDHFGPITATSANLHRTSDPTTIEPAVDQFGDNVDMYIDTGPCRFGKPSTVLDVSGETIKIIRDGACTRAELEDCLRGN